MELRWHKSQTKIYVLTCTKSKRFMHNFAICFIKIQQILLSDTMNSSKTRSGNRKVWPRSCSHFKICIAHELHLPDTYINCYWLIKPMSPGNKQYAGSPKEQSYNMTDDCINQFCKMYAFTITSSGSVSSVTISNTSQWTTWLHNSRC